MILFWRFLGRAISIPSERYANESRQGYAIAFPKKNFKASI